MNNKKRVLLFIITYFFFSCGEYKQWWTDYKPDELWQVQPDNVAQSVNLLDSILSANAKNQFKNTTEAYAVVELSRQQGDAFINGWRLNLIPKPGALYSYFNSRDISDPNEMIRIIFTCYHQQLNYKFYDENAVIAQFKLFWINFKSNNEYSQPLSAHYNRMVYRLSDEIKTREDSISNKFHFDMLKAGDTLIASMFYESHRFTKFPMSYTIESQVIGGDSTKNDVSVVITKIFADDRNTLIWYDDKVHHNLGDTLVIRADRWAKKDARRYRYW